MFNQLQLLADYGFPAFIALLLVYFGFAYLKTLITKKVKSLAEENLVQVEPAIRLNNTGDLRYHAFFQNAQYRLVVEIPNLDLAPDKPVKQGMFRDLLYWKIKYTHDMCQELAVADMDGWSSEKWASEVTKRLGDMLISFSKKSIEYGIPELVMSKFNKWHAPTMEMLYDYINVLGTSSIYSNNTARTNTLFLIMDLLLVTTIGDAERSLRELNGEIGGKQYNNKTLEH